MPFEPTSKRNAVLLAFKSVIESALEVDGEKRVYVGVVKPQSIRTEWMISIFFHSDTGHFADGMSAQLLRVVVQLVFKAQASADVAETQLIQANEIYDQVHAAIEAADDAPKGTAFEGVVGSASPAASGIECEGYDIETDRIVTIGEVWDTTYQRTRGAA